MRQFILQFICYEYFVVLTFMLTENTAIECQHFFGQFFKTVIFAVVAVVMWEGCVNSRRSFPRFPHLSRELRQQPGIFSWRYITQPCLHSPRIVKAFDPGEHCLPQLVPRSEVPEMDTFLLQGGKETFRPCVVPRHPYPGKALPYAVQFQ